MARSLRLAALAMLIAGALASMPGFAQAATPDLDAVIARYIAWRGGNAFVHLRSIHETGEVATAGLTGTIDAWTDARGRSRQTIDLGAVKQIHAGDGRQGWSLTTGGQIESRPTAEAMDSRRETLLAFANVFDEAKAALLPDETDEGRVWRVVRLTFGDDDRYDLFIDGETGALGGYRARQDRRTHLIHFADWRLVDGVRMAWTQRQTSQDVENSATIQMRQIALNGDPPDDWLDRPRDIHLARFKNGNRTEWISFEFFGRNRIFIPATVNGVKTSVMLDTGAGTSAIDQEFATTLAIGGQGHLTARGAGGTASAQVATGVSVALGSLELNLTIAVLPLTGMEPIMGHKLPMILGKEVFAETVAEIDFARQRIAFYRADAYGRPRHTTVIPLQIVEGGLRAMEIQVEHGRAILAQFDLGNGSPLLLYPSYWTTHDMKQGRPSTEFLDGGVGGMALETEISVEHLSVGGFSFEDVPTGLINADVAAADSVRVQANIGLPVFRRFRLAIDFPHERLFVAPEPNIFDRPFEKDRAGLRIEPVETGGIVRFVAPGSPAAAQGWQIGDHIAEVNGKTLTPRTLGWRLGEPGTRVVLDGTDHTGNPFHRELVLATFY